MNEERTSRMNKGIAGALSLVLAAGVVAGYSIQRARAAGIPSMQPMTYSGVLTNDAGTPLTGPKNIQISVYNMATAGTLLCTVGPSAIALSNGGFQIPLPDTCTSAIHANPDAWIEVFVDGASLGRTKLGAVPYALEADHARAADSATNATNATTASVAQAVNATLGSVLAGSPSSSTPFTWQAGTFVGTADASGHLVVSFPSAFPKGLVSVVVTNSYAQGATVTGTLDNETAAGFTAVLGANQRVRLNWIALGW